MPKTAELKILVIDDENEISDLITAAAQQKNLTAVATTNPEDFLSALNPRISLLFIDLVMPTVDGVELLRMLGTRQCKNKIILMSGVDKRVLEIAKDLAESLGLNVVDILQKPFRIAELNSLLQQHCMSDDSQDHEKIIRKAEISKTSEILTREELQRGIQQQEFVLYYQPQIEIATRKIIGVEALIRWQHIERGLIFPDGFISLAESFGLIDQLGWLVAERSLKEIKELVPVLGFMPSLSLNVSPFSLHDLKFPDAFSILATQSEIGAENIILEITESGLLKELSSALDILTRLRMKKFKLSIDDFGTGYAMMQQLQHVPATELKIDKSLVQDVHMQDSSRIMVKKIIEMGHDLNIRIIAEGVETAEQLEFLRENKCDIAQGYYFSRPIPMPELIEWVRKFS